MSVQRYLSSRWAGIVAIIWLCAISFLYVKEWNPVKPHPLSIVCRQLPLIPYDISASIICLLAEGLPELLLLALGVLAALGAGDFILSCLTLRTDKGQRLTLSLALGLGMLSYYTFGLGLLKGYNGTGIALSRIVLLLLSVRGLAVLLASLKGTIRGHGYRSSHVWFCMLVCTVMLFLFSKALKPAVFYDAITYHLGVPNYYIQEGGISYIPYDSYSNFPFMAEMLYTLGMLLSGLKLAQFTSVLIFLLSVLLVYDFTRSFVPEVNPALPALFYLSIPAFIEASILYTNDLHLAYYTLVCIYSVLLWERRREPGALVLAGICAGICFSVKCIALMFIPCICIMGIVLIARKEGKAAIIKAIALWAVPAAVVFLPWALKNFINTGNPVYPALYTFLGGHDMTAGQYNSIITMGHRNKDILTGMLVHPWKLFLTHPQSPHYVVGSNLSPLIVLFTPCLLFAGSIPPAIKKIALFAAASFFIWNATFIPVRFLYPAITLLLIVSACALGMVRRNLPAGTGTLIAAGASCYMLLNFCMGLYEVNARTATWGMNLLDETDNRYLTRHMIDDRKTILDSVPIYNYINEHTEREAVVLIIGDAQHLYIKRKHRYTYLSGSTPYEIFKSKAGNHAEIAHYLKGKGITHIVFNPSEMIRLQQSGAINYPEEDNVHIQNFLQSGYAKYITAYKRAFIQVYLFAL